MKNETLLQRQFVCLLFMFYFGSTAIMGMGPNVEQDSWISIALAAVFSLPIILLFGRLRSLHPDRNFFEILDLLFGPFLGGLLTLLMTWYCFHLCSLVLRNFSEFIAVSVMPETPQIPLMLLMLSLMVYLIRSGVEAMGKWAMFTMPVIVLVVVLTILLSLNRMDFSRILPVMGHDFGAIVSSALPPLSFPFLEVVVFVCAFQGCCKQGGAYRGYLLALAIAIVCLVFVELRNILLLGTPLLDSARFPSYIAAKVIKFGKLISHLEGSISINLVLGGIVKCSVCLLAAARGVAHLFRLETPKNLLLPLGLLVTALASRLFHTTAEMFYFVKFYPYYAFPFQLVIPILTWIFAEVRAKREKQEKLEKLPPPVESEA